MRQAVLERLGCTWVAGGEKKAYLNRIAPKIGRTYAFRSKKRRCDSGEAALLGGEPLRHRQRAATDSFRRERLPQGLPSTRACGVFSEQATAPSP
ncbi:MAG: hypothetical protein ICV78_09405 [Tolypothrix sp. Co-bin9]|nr:hypothetical protein [Tolypothrix sp. Co-bin9]